MTTDQLISLLASIALIELMVSIGLGVTFADLFGVARNWRLVAKALIANYLCVPAVALGLLLWFQSQPLIAAGFLIAAVCPGAPYGPPFTGLAKGDVVAAVGLMVILAGSSAFAAPMLLYLLLPVTSGDQAVEVDTLRLMSTLLLTQFLPLCVGLALRHWRPALADRLAKPAKLLSLILNLALLSALLYIQREMLMGIPLRAFFGMLALVLLSVAAGWLLGGPGMKQRTSMVMATAVRNVGVALVIATASFPGTPAVSAATAFAIFQTLVMALVALAWGRLPRGSPRESCAYLPPRRADRPTTAAAPGAGGKP